MKEHYDLLIFGATALGIGAAEANRGNAVAVIEAGCICAPEFVSAWKEDPEIAVYRPETENASALLAEFHARKAQDWLPACSPILAEQLVHSQADAYFMSFLSDITTEGPFYRVTFVSYGVSYTVTAAYLLDTTSQFVSRQFLTDRQVPAPAAVLNYVDENREVHSWSCPEADAGEISGARLSLLQHSVSSRKILMIAETLCCTSAYADMPLGSCACWMPSDYYSHFLKAYDAGASFHPHPDGNPIVFPAPIQDAGTYDVIVVGLGTAGMTAALTAAKEGLSVLGLESLDIAGGSTTAGSILGYYYGVPGGTYLSFDESAHGLDSQICNPGGVGISQKAAFFDMEAQNRVTVRYHASLLSVIRDRMTVTGVRFTSGGLQWKASAAYVIDCTSEAAAAVSAGCRMQGGRSSDGAFQPYSSVFRLYNGKAISASFIDNGRVNPYDADAFGKEILRSAVSYVHLRPDYADHTYFGISPLIGLREGKRIIGEETVTPDSLFSQETFQNAVCLGFSNLDNHGKDSALEDRFYQDMVTIAGLWGWAVSIPLPKGALIPKGMRGLLVAGRAVSTDHTIAMAFRMKADCHKTGEAAAQLAVQSLKENIPAADVSAETLRQKLYETGCLKESDCLKFDCIQKPKTNPDVLWCREDQLLSEGLAGDAPGWYIWSAKMEKKTLLLRQLLSSDNGRQAANAALSLALLNDRSGIPVLLKLAQSKDGYLPQSGREYMTLHAVSAISALGRLRAPEAVPVLFELLKDRSFTDTLPFTPNGLIVNREDLRFQFDLTCICALAEISEVYETEEIRKELSLCIKNITLRTTMMGTDILQLDLMRSVLSLISG